MFSMLDLIVPIALLSLALAAGIFVAVRIYRKRKQRKQQSKKQS
jgi:type II secretory pathway pseudopilin PulG